MKITDTHVAYVLIAEVRVRQTWCQPIRIPLSREVRTASPPWTILPINLRSELTITTTRILIFKTLTESRSISILITIFPRNDHDLAKVSLSPPYSDNKGSSITHLHVTFDWIAGRRWLLDLWGQFNRIGKENYGQKTLTVAIKSTSYIFQTTTVGRFAPISFVLCSLHICKGLLDGNIYKF